MRQTGKNINEKKIDSGFNKKGPAEMAGHFVRR